jgi:peptidoglycan/LPS O-acetylase OafA/YrhL
MAGVLDSGISRNRGRTPVNTADTADNATRSLGYRPELDGVRAIATLMVMLFHSNSPHFSGGFIGVDLFFVLSGFLITSILLAEHAATGQIAYRNFLAKRALRLIPALWVFLAVYLLLCFIFATTELGNHLADAFLAATYLANWTRAIGLNRPTMLGHTWSLAIEEQFYLLWPLLLGAILLRTGTVRSRALAIFGLAFAVIVTRATVRHFGASPERIYNGLDVRSDGLLIGCGIGVLYAYRVRTLPLSGTPLAIACLTGMILMIPMAMWDSVVTQSFGYPLASILAGGLIYSIAHNPEMPLSRVLRWSLFVWTGKISYGLYLWHFPIMFLLMHRDFSWPAIFGIGLATSYVLATLSYLGIERRFLRLKHHFGVKAAVVKDASSQTVVPES